MQKILERAEEIIVEETVKIVFLKSDENGEIKREKKKKLGESIGEESTSQNEEVETEEEDEDDEYDEIGSIPQLNRLKKSQTPILQSLTKQITDFLFETIENHENKKEKRPSKEELQERDLYLVKKALKDPKVDIFDENAYKKVYFEIMKSEKDGSTALNPDNNLPLLDMIQSRLLD